MIRWLKRLFGRDTCWVARGQDGRTLGVWVGKGEPFEGISWGKQRVTMTCEPLTTETWLS